MNIFVQFILGSIVVFAFVIFVLRKIVVADTSSALNKLNEAAKRKQKSELEMEHKLKSCQQECEAKLEAAKQEATKIVRDARSAAEEESKKNNLDEFSKHIPGQSSLVFTNIDLFELKEIFHENEWMVPAKPNEITPVDI